MDNSSLSLVDSLIAGGPGFQASCLSNLRTGLINGASSIELVGETGQRLATFSNDTWGITTATCYAYCSDNRIPSTFNYPQFANAMTNYFLPWLALTAQLPYETGDQWASIMAFCLAVGSPALITYSLTLTILNRSWARKCFAGLRSQAAELHTPAPRFREKVSAIQFSLQESQQVPIRTNLQKNWLASLIVLPQNITWWTRVQARLKGTRRGFSQSLIAQISLAVIAYALTVVAALATQLGDPNTALQLASGCLWIWLVPVITGWVMAGSQVTGDAVYNALHDGNVAWRTLHPVRAMSVVAPNQTDPDGTPRNLLEQAAQSGIECGGGERSRLQSSPRWCGFSVGGDEEITGPAYNYARLFTWWQVTTVLRDSLKATLDEVETNELKLDGKSQIDSTRVASVCGLSREGNVKDYLEWNKMPAQVWRYVFSAAVAAIFVQWGTAGDSIMTAYMTPTIGLGCRSGSYLIYACASTLAFFLLLAGKFCSHEAMLRYQHSTTGPAHTADSSPGESTHLIEMGRVSFQISGTSSSGPSEDHSKTPIRVTSVDQTPDVVTRTRPQKGIRAAAVILRLLGKGLCILNTIWLILTSILELVGRFDNCWCQGNHPTLGDNGYIVLFKTAKDLAQTASVYWGAGLAMTIVVVLLVVFFFALGMWDPDAG